MPFDPVVATVFRASVEGCISALQEAGALKTSPAVTTRLMMGGECVMIGGNMVGGVCSQAKGGDIILRVGKEQHEHALSLPNINECDFTGRKMNGFVKIDVAGLGLDKLKKPESISAKLQQKLDSLVMLGTDFASSLPVKGAKKNTTKRKTTTAKRKTTSKKPNTTSTKRKTTSSSRSTNTAKKAKTAAAKRTASKKATSRAKTTKAKSKPAAAKSKKTPKAKAKTRTTPLRRSTRNK